MTKIKFRIPPDEIDSRQAADKARGLVMFFYILIAFIAFSRLEGLSHLLSLGDRGFSPRWPIFWAGYLDYETAATSIILFFLITSILAVFFYKRWEVRILGFLGFFQFHAFNTSFGGPNHQWDLWLWVLLLLVFLPDIWKKKASREERKEFLLVFWGVQAFVLLTYSMSGVGKIAGAFVQASQGQVHAFLPQSASLHAATLLYRMGEITPLGPFVIRYPLISWLGFLAFIYLQLFSFWAAFKPSLHRTWGLGLVLFHAGTYLAMRAIFVSPVPLLLLLFLDSPFQKSTSLKATLRELPIFGFLARFVYKKID